ncbi:MAG: His/Gly/Thr/Pro-type tRNA ligase C-terminal domain-containing protein [Chlamydiales bacterium]
MISKILAAAVLELFPETLLIPSKESNGTPVFGSDFVFPFVFSAELLPLIEEKMREIMKEKRAVKMLEMAPVSASAFLMHKKQTLLAEAIQDSEESLVSLIQMGEFIDVCASGLSGTYPTYFKLLNFSEQKIYKGSRVTRISGAAFETKEALKSFLKKHESFPQRDHLRIGQELDLFTFIEERLFWHPRGEQVRNLFLDFWKSEMTKHNFELISTVEASDNLTENHTKYFQATGRPRLAETSLVTLDDPMGWERGLLTPKRGVVDRAHLFCSRSDLLKESISCLQFIVRIFKILQFKFRLVLCSSGEGEQREKEVTFSLEKALHHLGHVYTIEKRRETAIELFVQDGMGQEWKTAFFKVDRRLPKEEILLFSLFNPMEKLIALLLEDGEGYLPLWLAPEQVRVIGVKEDEYTQEVMDLLLRKGIRSAKDIRGEKLAVRLHEAMQRKIPWLLVVGEQEKEQKLVTARATRSGDIEKMPIENFVQNLQKELRL